MTNPAETRRIDQELHRTLAGSDPFAAAMRSTRMPMLITDPRQTDNPIVFVNDAFARLTGYSREETLGRNCRFLQGPGTNLEDIRRIREAIAERRPIEIEILNYAKSGKVFWNRVLISPVFDGDELTFFFASQLDVTRDKLGDPSLDANSDDEMRRRIVDLTAAEERLQFTLKAAGLGTWTLDVPQQRLVASAICKANFGRGPSDNFDYSDLQSSIHPEDIDRWRETLGAALAGDGDFGIEYRINLPGGGQRWIEIRAQTRFGAGHAPLSMSGISVDITERKETEAYRNLVTAEMGHRIKNTLATVQAIVSQSLRSDAPREVLRDIISQRLEALGGAHDTLTRRNWDVVGLRQTVERAIRAFNSHGRIHYFGPDMEITQKVSETLALALHELSTNAVKYGALSGDEGRVRIEWGEREGEFALTWDETGGPPVSAPTRSGFGSKLIERALSSAVKGTGVVDYRPEGIHFELRTQSSNIHPA